MDPWLEKEEKKALERLQQEENLHKTNASLNAINKEIHNNLSSFYNLCQRVRAIKPALNISECHVTGFGNTIYNKPASYLNIYRRLRVKRHIRFYSSDSETLLIDILIEECMEVQLEYDYLENPKMINNTRLVTRSRFLMDDLINWGDEKMINIIKWLLFEPVLQDYFGNYDSDIDEIWIQYLRFLSFPNNDLPGKIQSNLLFDIVPQIATCLEELREEKSILSNLNEWHFGRTEDIKDQQISLQNQILRGLTAKILKLGIVDNLK